jgi:hypothetical protein
MAHILTPSLESVKPVYEQPKKGKKELENVKKSRKYRLTNLWTRFIMV